MAMRYSFGGDEHVFVECDEEMSLEAFFKSSRSPRPCGQPNQGRDGNLPGQRFLQIKFDPDAIGPTTAGGIKKIEAVPRATTPSSRRASSRFPCSTTIPGPARP